MKVFSVAGFHHTGKTTVVVNLIKEMKRRNHSIVSIKDIHAENFSMEKEGSNSWKHWSASNDVVFARGLKETYQIWHRRLTLNEMLSHLVAEYVIVEGMRSEPLPRIICAKDETQLQEIMDNTVFAISGIFADSNSSWHDLPVYKSDSEIGKLADLVEEKVFPVLPIADEKCCTACGMNCREMVGAILSGIKKRSDCVIDSNKKIKLIVDGKEIKLVYFVQDIISDVTRALIRNLKNCEKGKISIEID